MSRSSGAPVAIYPSERLIKAEDAEHILNEAERYYEQLVQSDGFDSTGTVEVRLHIHQGRITGVSGGFHGAKHRGVGTPCT